MREHDLAVTLSVLTVSMLVLVGGAIWLLLANQNRRIRHRAELAEAERQRAEEVTRVEREAVQATLTEVGRELHDNVAQLLSVAQLGVNNTLLTQGPSQTLEAAREALDQGVEEVRRLGHSLNTDLWQQRSLADAIGAEAERIERVGRVRAHVLCEGEPPALGGDRSTILFRLFQEVVNNALKHSGADTIEIMLRKGPPFVLRISDNGRGFAPDTTAGHGGAVNIARRCDLIGFTAACTTAPGAGCTWTFTQRTDERGTHRFGG